MSEKKVTVDEDTAAAATDPAQVAATDPAQVAATKAPKREVRPKNSWSAKRTLVALAVFVAVAVGLVFHTGVGTLSSWGWDWIATVCPLGFLETLLARWTLVPQSVIAIAITVALVLVFGRAFCGWLCPVPFTRKVFGGKKFEHRDVSDACTRCGAACGKAHGGEAGVAGAACSGEAATPGAACSGEAATPDARGVGSLHLDSRHAVLGGALLSTAILGFPVYCLVCPVGLTFATFIGIWHLFQFNEPSWGLIVFPIIIVLEVFVFRKWCHRICPMGALFSLISKGNRTLRPQVDAAICLRTSRGIECGRCLEACDEGIDLHDLAAGAPLSECTRCGDCKAVCPTGAITFPFRGSAGVVTVEGDAGLAQGK